MRRTILLLPFALLACDLESSGDATREVRTEEEVEAREVREPEGETQTIEFPDVEVRTETREVELPTFEIEPEGENEQ